MPEKVSGASWEGVCYILRNGLLTKNQFFEKFYISRLWIYVEIRLAAAKTHDFFFSLEKVGQIPTILKIFFNFVGVFCNSRESGIESLLRNAIIFDTARQNMAFFGRFRRACCPAWLWTMDVGRNVIPTILLKNQKKWENDPRNCKN